MGAPSSPGPASSRAASRSISFYLGAGLIVPMTSLLVIWGLVTWLVLGGWLDKLSWLRMVSPAHRTMTGVAVIAGAGLLVVIVVVIRLGRLMRQLSREISGLTAAVSDLADEQLPRVVTALRDGEQVAATSAAQRPSVRITEIADAVTAVDGLYRAAVAGAATEAALRNGFRQILVSLGRRNQSLLHRQLRIIDSLEQQAPNPTALADLFSLDHLTTRMRRHAESLSILSGAPSGRTWSGPVPVIDVMRAAVAEVEDYTRVTVISDSDDAVAAPAVTDMIHLLAELIENATLFSPSSTRVEVRADRVANGFAVEIEDRGLGIPQEQLTAINAQLANPPDFDIADADRLGLFVAGRLAARHGVLVSLAPSPYRGTKAVVVLPDSIVVAPLEHPSGAWAAIGAGMGGGAAEGAGTHPHARLDLASAGVLSLAGAAFADQPPRNGKHEFTSVADDISGTNGADAIGAIRGLGLNGLDGADADAEQPPPTTLNGLPRRVRPQAAPDPRGDPAPGALSRESMARHVPPEGPAPEEARSLAASLQNSWQRSRQTDEPPDSESADSDWPPRRRDFTGPDRGRHSKEE
jgi:signal transduction histidine kinase